MDDALHTTEFDLGSIEVTTPHSDLSAVLTCSCMLSLPDIWDHVPNAIELSEASSKGTIWVAKAGGGCQLDFSTLLNETSLDSTCLDSDTKVAISHLAAGCGIWQELGLDLRLKHAHQPGLDRNDPEAKYFLHHPDLSSSLIAPPELPVASFQGLKAEIHYRINMTYSKDEQTEAAEANRLALEDRMEEALTLLDIAFQKLIGIKKSIPGVRVTKTINDLPSLIDIAPAVWNLPYLQLMAVHAQMIPSLASSIARLKHSRSFSLRKKVESLMPGYMDSEIRDNEDEIEGEIRKRLWLRCQTGIRPDPIKKNNTAQTKLEEASQEETSQGQLGGLGFVEEKYDHPGREDALIRRPFINLHDYATTANQIAHCYDMPEGIYDGEDDNGCDNDNSSSETGSLPPCSSSDIAAIHSDNWQGSSEAEYFYIDSQGNVITLQHDSETEESEETGSDCSSSVDTMDIEHDPQ
ncbi:hypothetical protein QBC36DRAFT_356274 [Triangularia setosa]|uniref:Uncharacterized protein n=1 Tax=Triangularia setosa TaxID=2587417 RepID=A0AAN6WFQ0_9PEZI|nr:hypothetical protein QBC36DRAFT_356274 [Podospora setosa]